MKRLENGDRFPSLTAARVDGDPIHPARFVLRPGGAIRLATCSSGEVGRLTASEALDIVRSANGRLTERTKGRLTERTKGG